MTTPLTSQPHTRLRVILDQKHLNAASWYPSRVMLLKFREEQLQYKDVLRCFSHQPPSNFRSHYSHFSLPSFVSTALCASIHFTLISTACLHFNKQCTDTTTELILQYTKFSRWSHSPVSLLHLPSPVSAALNLSTANSPATSPPACLLWELECLLELSPVAPLSHPTTCMVDMAIVDLVPAV
jgi:hypothetical protein